MSTERCPICGSVEKGLFLDETDGWFICSKCGSKVNNRIGKAERAQARPP